MLVWKNVPLVCPSVGIRKQIRTSKYTFNVLYSRLYNRSDIKNYIILHV